jgi:hypothetical protein
VALGPSAVVVEMGRSEGNDCSAAALTAEPELGFSAARQHRRQPPNLLVHVPLHVDSTWFDRSSESTPRKSRHRRPYEGPGGMEFVWTQFA